MKKIITILSFITFFTSNIFSQDKVVVNIGGQMLYQSFASYYLFTPFDRIDLYDVDYTGLLLNIGGEAKIGNKLSTALNVGLLGKKSVTFSVEENNSTRTDLTYNTLSLDPIRFYFKEALNGAFIGPRALFSSASSDNGSSIQQFGAGLVFGFTYSPPGKPISIGFNFSALGPIYISDVPDFEQVLGYDTKEVTGQGIFTIGYKL